MKPDNVLSAKNRNELRQWLEHNHLTEKECWVAVKRGRPTSDDVFWYVDAVEEALCFGWIDSTTKTLQDGVTYQKLAPRKKGSLWSELNKERCRRMDKLGMMTEYGRAVLPDMTPAGFVIDDDILAALQTDDVVWSNFQSFPGIVSASAYRYNSNKEEATETVPCTIAEIDRQHTKRRYVRGMER